MTDPAIIQERLCSEVRDAAYQLLYAMIDANPPIDAPDYDEHERLKKLVQEIKEFYHNKAMGCPFKPTQSLAADVIE